MSIGSQHTMPSLRVITMPEDLEGVGITTTGGETVVVAEFGEAGAWLEIDASAVVRQPDWAPIAEGETDE